MFNNIISQNKVKQILSDQIKNNKIPHAFIFMGENGIGKRKTALEFTKILCCTMNDYTKTDIGACNHCIACEKINKGAYADLHIIDFEKQAELREEEIEKQKTIKIDTIREMQKTVYLKTVEGKWKIFIIEPAEKMTVEAANCLLKTLEEPPENTVLILIAKHKETIPITIISRSQTLFFQPLPAKDISQYLIDAHSLSRETADKLSTQSEGSIELAEKLMLNTQNEYSALWKKLTGKTMPISDILMLSKEIAKDRTSAIEAIDIITEEAVKDFRKKPEIFLSTIEKLALYKTYLNQNINPTTVLDNLFMDLNSKK